jgi:hypothetical protein
VKVVPVAYINFDPGGDCYFDMVSDSTSKSETD